jgi:N-acetylmuramoyl-L-alanine amidase
MGIEYKYKYICMEEKEMSLTLNMIMPGSSGEDVCFARRMLRVFESCDLAEEGIFDSQTEDYVKSFQKKCGLLADGKIGPMTWSMLAPTLSQNYNYWNREKVVKLIQSYLKKQGYIYFLPDGIYGAWTQAAVEAFQLAHGLPLDGVWGKPCWDVWFADGHSKKFKARSFFMKRVI